MKKMHDVGRWVAAVAGNVLLGGALSAQAADVPGFSVAYGRSWDVAADADAGVGGIVVGGTLRKLGAGTLAVTNTVFSEGGGLAVAQGGAVLRADASLAGIPPPERLLTDNNLLLWLDASVNVVEESGMVVRWHDVREADPDAPAYRYAERWPGEPGPTVKTLAWNGGRPYLDFGPMQSNGCWMTLMRPTGGAVTTNSALSGQSFFVVRGTISPTSNATGFHGFFFGGWWGTGTSGTRDFHVGNSSGGGAELWNAEAVPNLQRAVTSLDGRPVNGRVVRPNDWLQLLGLHLPKSGGVQFSNFFNDRNYTPYNGAGNFRQGGGQLGEVLVFQNAPTDDELAAVEGYLLTKWVNRSQGGTVRTSAGAQTELAAATGTTLTLGGVGGEGRIVKTGPGTVHLKKAAALPPREFLLEEGDVEVGPLVTHGTLVLDAGADGWTAAGRRLTASAAGVFSAEATAEAGVLEKAGAGTWTLASVPADVGTVRVADGTLRVAPRQAATAPPAVSALVPNADFEAWTGGSFSRGPGTVLAGWTFDGGRMMDGAAEVDYGSGVARRGSPWMDAPVKTVDGGDVVCIIQRKGGCQVDVTLPEAGRYRLTFAHALRTSNAAHKHLLDVTFDGAEAGRFEGASAVFVLRSALFPYRPAGTYTLRFQGVHLQVADSTSLIDDIRVTRLPDDEDGGNLVPDGSFEATGNLPGLLTAQTRFGEGSAIVTAGGWTFTDPEMHLLAASGSGNYVGGTNYASSGVAEDTTGEWMLPPPDGARCAFIFSDGQISVPLTFPKGGVYRLSFQGAGGGDNSRYSRNGWGGSPNALLPLNILLDGTNINVSNTPSMTLETPVFQPFDVLLPPVTNNQTAVLTFAGATGTNTWTRIGLIDDVRVVYAGPVALANPGFEKGEVDWEFLTSAESGVSDVKSGIAGAYGSWANRVVSGRQVAFLQRTATIAQTVAVPESGAYTVSFLAATRWERKYEHGGHDFAVQWDGETVGAVRTEDYLFTRYTFRLPHVAAGPHTLTFRGLPSSGIDGISTAAAVGGGFDTASAIDDVRVERLVVEAEGFAPFPPRLILDVAAGACLSLDFEGVQPLYRLRVGGRLVSGLISAATHPGVITGAGALRVNSVGTVFTVQ